MLFTSWRIVPLMALASRDPLAGSNDSLPSLLDTLTSGFCDRESWPPLPLTLIWSSLISTFTSWGTATGIFPTRDISWVLRLRDVAEDFAADAACARLAVRHHALGGGHDGPPQAGLHLRDDVT